MNKYAIVLITLFVCNVSFSQKNQGTILYKKEMAFFSKLESKKASEKKEKYKKVLGNMEVVLKDLRYELVFKEQRSVFRVKKSLELEGNKLYKLVLRADGNGGTHYTDIENEKHKRLVDNYGELFLVDYPKHEWTLYNETQIIGKYTCYKAAVKLNNNERVIAWYAPKIPLSFGPAQFYGLPGLIIKLQTKNFTFIVDKITFSTDNNFVMEKPKKGISVTKKEYDKIGIKAKGDFKKGLK